MFVPERRTGRQKARSTISQQARLTPGISVHLRNSGQIAARRLRAGDFLPDSRIGPRDEEPPPLGRLRAGLTEKDRASVLLDRPGIPVLARSVCQASRV
jgi:hypothetical protein